MTGAVTSTLPSRDRFLRTLSGVPAKVVRRAKGPPAPAMRHDQCIASQSWS